jgi:hypothetical protein
MAAEDPFAGVDQSDVALIETGGVAYRCYVWQRNTERTLGENSSFYGARVEAAIFVEGKHGQSTQLWRGAVRAPPTGSNVDSPRVVALGTTFHVHWIEYDPEEGLAEVPTGRELRRSTFDVAASPYAWTHQGAIATSHLHLYDTQSIDASEDYILVHVPTPGEVSMLRVNGASWVDNEWVETQAGLTMSPNVLACCANLRAPTAIYQSGTALQAFSRFWDDGLIRETPTTLTDSVGDFTAVGVCRRLGADGSEMFVVAEYLDSVLLYDELTEVELPATLHFDAIGAELELEAVTITRNTTLQSKPWRYYSSQSTLQNVPQMFAVLGHQGARVNQEWLQSNYYVARYEQASSAVAGRPIPVATLSSSIADARKHGGTPRFAAGVNPLAATGDVPRKRRNHLSSASPAPSFGPLAKSYTVALGEWSRIDRVAAVLEETEITSGISVAGASIEAVRFHHDDAWAHPYDDSDAPLPSTPYASVGVPQLESVQAGSGVFVGGGTPQTYDGDRFVEAGFCWYPEIIDASEDPATGNTIGSGVYQYTVVLEWRDARGQTHRSRPAEPVTVENVSSRNIHLEIRCVNLSMKDNLPFSSLYSPVKMDVFRTIAGGQIFFPLYRGNDGFTTDLVDVPINDPTAATVKVEDAVSDLRLVEPFPLPFTQVSGAWSPIPAETVPALAAVATWQNRVFGVSSEDPKRIWISRAILPEVSGEKYTVPEFSPDLTYRIDEVTGRVVAMQQMDSALILFTPDAIYALTGTAPDATAQGSTLQLQLLQRDTGCIEPRSVAPAPDGIYFQSRRGFYKLSRQNALEYVGAPVEDELRAAGNIRAVTVHEDSHQVRVLCNGAAFDSPRVLVFDWAVGLWAVWPLPRATLTAGLSSAADAVVWRGHVGEPAHVVLQASGVLIQKASTSPTRYADESRSTGTLAIPVDVRTGWIHIAGLAGFKRVRKVGLHFTKPAQAAMTVELEYDMDGTQTDGSNLQTEVFAAGAVVPVEIRTAVQKCNGIRIRIYEGTATPTGSQLTASTLNLTAITLAVARKPGFSKGSPTTQRT